MAYVDFCIAVNLSFFRDFAPLHDLAFWKNNIGWSHKLLKQGTFATNLISADNTNWTNTNNSHKNFPSSRLSQRLFSNTLAPFLPTFRIIKLIAFVAAASLLIASRGGASLQKFEKCALTSFRLEPDPYESAHQLDCSCCTDDRYQSYAYLLNSINRAWVY